MIERFVAWCYGGKSKAFYKEQTAVIHQFNSKMLDRLLMIMTAIIGVYLMVSVGWGLFEKYSRAYFSCFIALLFLLCTFKLKTHKSVLLTKIYMILFATIMFAFVCVLGTVFEPDTRATLFIVYVLVMPMLFVVPTHHMYGFLISATGIFSIVALEVKVLHFAKMDIAHSLTCLVMGIFISHHILENRMALYAVNEQLENLTENIPGGVCQCRNDSRFTLLSVSDGFLSLFGYTRQEIDHLFGGSFLEMVHPDDRFTFIENISKKLQDDQDAILEYRAFCKSGKIIWILGKGRLLSDGNGGVCIYGILLEITDRKQEQDELRLRLEQHQLIMDQTTDILFDWDIRKDTLTFSSNWRKKFGYDPISNQISQRIPLSDNIHPDDMQIFMKIMRDTAAGKIYSEAEFRIKDNRGRYRWCRIRATSQFNGDGQVVKATGVILDIHTEKKERQILLRMAQQDALTGIYNKAATNSLVSRRMGDYDFTVLQALMIIDVDYFKTINDTYGHLAGDNILTAVAAQLKRQLRSSDVLGRIGGDEFLVYLPEVESEDVALWKAKELHRVLGTLTPSEDAEPITSSIGVAVFPHGVVDYTEFYQHADQALYECKKAGRNGVSLFDFINLRDESIGEQE